MSDAQYSALNSRLKAVEDTLLDIIEIQKKFISLSSIQKIVTTMETDITFVKDTLDALTNRVEILEEE